MMMRLRGYSLVAGLAVAAACGGTPTPSSPSPAQVPSPTGQGCARTSVGFTPLTEPGNYQGQATGLYGDLAGSPPAVHLSAGVLIARDIGPLDAEGRPSASGRYAFISVGMSNTTQEFSTFKPMADGDGSRDPRLTIVDGAQGGMTASQWANAGCSCWTVLDQRLASSGISARQVAVAWIKLADSQPGEGWPDGGRGAHGKENPRPRYAASLRVRPAPFVRGSSRRITIMRCRPANIRVINRRDSRLGHHRCCVLSSPEDTDKEERADEPCAGATNELT